MVDVVVFFKKDYTEKEIYKIADEVNARIIIELIIFIGLSA